MKKSTGRIFKARCRDKEGAQCWRWVRPVSGKTYKNEKNLNARMRFAELTTGSKYQWLDTEYTAKNVIYMDPVKFVRPTSAARVEGIHRAIQYKGHIFSV